MQTPEAGLPMWKKIPGGVAELRMHLIPPLFPGLQNDSESVWLHPVSNTITVSKPSPFRNHYCIRFHILRRDSVILNANTGSGLTYKWKKNGANISGATKTSYAAKTAGTYKVQVTNQSACTKLSAGVVVTVPCKEQQLTSSNSFVVYPNPNDGTFEISSSEDLTGSQAEIINLLGQKVFETQVLWGIRLMPHSFLPDLHLITLTMM
jgi:hypothetical protein